MTIGHTQQFTATGTYSDLSTANLTDSVTWSSSLTGTGTVSNTSGSQGLGRAVSAGATTITATSGIITGTAIMTVTPTLPPPPSPSMTVSPGSGPKRTAITLTGANFPANQAITVTYLAKSKYTVLCRVTTAITGTFSCRSQIPHGRRGGKRGQHVIQAKETSGAVVKARFTVTKPPKRTK